MTNNTITKDNAIDLAHTYWLYRDAQGKGDDIGVTIYGDWLLSKQDRMGVEMIDPLAIKMAIVSADQRLQALEA